MGEAIKRWVLCVLLGDHDWTSAAMEGRPPTKEQMGKGLSGYEEYAEMYCNRCGKVSTI
jgi:hypothetical protein